jgi:putative two-component system response regulator
MLTILQVEDNAENRVLVRRILEAVGHRVVEAHDGFEAVRLAREARPDLVIMDLHLPGMDGYAATARIKETPGLAEVPVVALTANVLAGDRERCLAAGCDGYIKKPIDVFNFADEIWQYYAGKREVMGPLAVAESPAEPLGPPVPAVAEPPPRWRTGVPLDVLLNWLDALESALASVHGYQEGHGRRTARYALPLGESLGLDRERLAVLARGCRLHDIGKAQVEMRYTAADGYLDSDAWYAFAAHPRHGAELLEGVAGLQGELAIIRHHHERWDGNGYPDGLRGEQIPPLAQICAVVESFDAMVTRSSYRRTPYTVEQAVAELRRCAGSQFAPRVVTAMVALVELGALAAP